ncbi:hypothetical protein BHX94_12400 (plasmid) [Macrococcoides bohemicum]|uniref:Gram-positive cocci surface proteins LPxTG domain-containing protein n=1 Tax=Macrococcoides bohemicum TaxID=1903056 RepID=A0A327ZZJ6_9STAP|nr:isopeptide-forming domain-containing fimbrial protein [Macrococcus bohemicus]RAK47652.1 hypothetical protein BHX94_12400 [Macrococcus bohemicus]
MKKNKTNNKVNTSKVTKLIIASGILAVPLMPNTAHGATQTILDAPNASLPTATDKAGAKYEFIAQFNPELTKVEEFGGKWEAFTINGNDSKYTTIINPTDTQKGNIGVKYTNVGIFNGKQIDLKITITDWKHSYANDTGRISFGNNEIAFLHRGYENVDYKLQYLDHETQQPVKVDGFMTVKDIDENQKLTFDSQTMQSIDQIYVPTKDTKVLYKANSDGSADFYSELYGNDGDTWHFDPKDPNELRGDFTFMYSGTDTLNISWGWQYTDEEKKANAEKTPDIKDWAEDSYLGAYLNYSALKPVATEILKPTKLVSDADEKQKNSTTLNAMNESLIYEVTHTVPLETEEFYYESYEIKDTLNNVLQLNGDVKVVNELNKDVTSQFTITTSGQNINAEAKGDFVLSDAFYNHTYKLVIPAKVKAGADLSTILKDGVYTVPNTAKVTVDGKDVSSNAVDSKLTPTKNLIDKGIVSGDKLVDSMNVKRNTEYKYNVDLTVSNDPMIKSLALKDDLVDELDYVSAKVLDSTGKDITAEGTLTTDATTELVTWTAKDPSKYIGKKLKLEITSKVKAGADLSKYKQADGTFVLPNTASAIINGGTPINSDTVKVIVPQDPTFKIGDTVWNDIDKDNVVDATEKGIPNAKVEVKDSTGKVIKTTTTNADGKYSVVDLPKGEYTVTFTPPTGYTPVDKAKLTQTITLDKDNLDVDLGLIVPVVPPAPKDPTKTVVDKSVLDANEKEVDATEVKKATDYKYRVNTTITDKKDIKSLEIQDDLEDVLEVKTAKVLDMDGKDITAEGTLTIDKEKEIISWKAKEPAKYAGQKLVLEVVAQVKKDADLSKYTDKDGNIVIPNTANVIVDGTTTPSDKVDVTVPKDPSKTVIKKTVSESTLELGQPYNYTVETTITDDKNVKEVTLIDDLEDVLEAKTAKVLDKDGKDITAEGILTIDEEKEIITWKAKDGSKYVGQKLTLAIDTFIKKDADLSKYTSEDGKVVIPNTAKTIVGIDKDGKIVEEEIESNKVDVTTTPKVEEPTTEEPTTEEPTTETPTTETPTTETPTTETPTTETPTTETPTTETPTTEKSESNNTDIVTSESPKSDEIKKPSNSILPDTGNESLNYLLYAGVPILLIGAVGYMVYRRKSEEL